MDEDEKKDDIGLPNLWCQIIRNVCFNLSSFFFYLTWNMNGLILSDSLMTVKLPVM